MKSQTTLQTAEPRICFSYARVSSEVQTADDKTGIDRQLETARRVVAMHPGWELDETLSIADLGLSGYSGKNLTDKAALGALLKALRAGKIPPGRIMIIEALDRLTRTEIDEAYDLFRDILRAGLEIYVDRGGRHFTKASLKSPTDLIITIVELAAGNEYSAKLGERVSRAWKIKKQRLAETGKPYRTKPPGWLKWNETTQAYDADKEKVNSIKRLFALALAGHGVRNICMRLNREKVPVIGNYCGKKVKSVRWSNVVVNNILRSQKVIGINENVQPPVKMYPQVIDDKVYYAAKAKMDERKTHKYYGRTTEVKNLFSGIVWCAECNRKMCLHGIKSYSPKRSHNYGSRGGLGARGGKAVNSYLWCGGHVTGDCSGKQIWYDSMEESFVAVVSGSVHILDYDKTPVASNDSEMLKGQLAEARTKLGEYTADYEAAPSKTLAGMMLKQETEIERLSGHLERATTIAIGTQPLYEAKKELLGCLYKDWSNQDTRLKVRELIRTMVDKLEVDTKAKWYVIHWKGTNKQTRVEVFRKGYKIDGHQYPSVGDWQKHTAEIAERVKDAEKSYSPIAS
jgi:hypothetical protein